MEIKSVPEFTKPQLEKELQYLKDPLRLAENTTSLLKNGEYEKAIEMVRLASRNTSCTVSWNHLIDYYMNRGETQKATKLYYEVRNYFISK